jgi:Golgi phosphoprotein 3
MTTLIRRTVKNTSSESASNNVLQSYENDGDRDDEHDNDDDKETRLTLMEEILLLGLKDREVCGLEF